MLLQERGEPLGHQGIHDGTHFAVAQLGFGLALELGLVHFYGDDRRQGLPGVLAFQVGVGVL